jgi:hypothetical protein
VGVLVGTIDGIRVGEKEGDLVGVKLGFVVGLKEGKAVGAAVGIFANTTLETTPSVPKPHNPTPYLIRI